jgi:hypothetical protein
MENAVKSQLVDVDAFGAVDADADKLLDLCFEDHEAYRDAKSHEKFLVLGRKGSGKTAIYRKLIRERRYNTFSFGHDFTDYPWHLHNKQAQVGVPEEHRYLQSWRYLILLTLSKLLLNQDSSQPWSDASNDALAKIERFVVDTYASNNPDIAQIFSPVRKLRFKSSLEISWPLKLSISAEGVPISELPTIVQEVNSNLLKAVIESLNPEFNYYICFDQLDLGFDNSTDYKSRLIGLLLAARGINIAAREANKKLTARTTRTLKQLMEKRFAEVLSIPEEGAWERVFDETEQMSGRQSKYQHMLDRTFLRPRDMIQFTNEVLKAFKREAGTARRKQFNNRDVQVARGEYSAYLLSELDDEVPKHYPNFRTYIEILKSMESLQFTLVDFEEGCKSRSAVLQADVMPRDILNALFEFSIVGCYAPGGGFGGSEYIWKYKDARAYFNEAALNYRIHPGLKEVLGVKKWTKSE